MKDKRVYAYIMRYILLIVLTLVWITPVYIMIISSVKTTGEMFDNVFRIPKKLILNNYLLIWSQTDLLKYFTNNVIVTVSSLILIVAIASMASYGVYRSRIKIVNSLYYIFVLGLMIPTQVGMVTIYLTMRSLSLYDSIFGLIALYTSVSMPIAVFVYTGFFRDMPAEILEAAVIDGAGEFAIFRRIVMPLCKNISFTVMIISGVFVWNDFTYPLILIKNIDLRTLQYGLYSLKGEFYSNYPLLFAGVVFISIPVILLYAVLQKQFIAGMTAGAVKG